MDEKDRGRSTGVKTASRGKKLLKRFGLLLFTLFFLGAAFVTWTNVAAVLAGAGKLFDDPARLPDDGVMLVFGCDDWIDGRENLYFRYRIDAAAEVWKAGKARCVIVSGHREKYYNEPERMRMALIEKGVPADKIVCDYDGLRTLDSVVRAKEIFGVEDVVFVSQQFQNERAAYLAKANGFKSYSGYNARDVEGQGGLKTRIREVGARVKMWLDVRVLGTRPKRMGEKIPLAE